MAAYQTEFSRSARKDMDRLSDRILVRVLRTIESLADSPRPRGVRKLKDSIADYRIRVGDYRIIYEIDDVGRRIIVLYVRHRREAYR